MTVVNHQTADATALAHAPGAPGSEWWRKAVIYQVYPRSFADASGDGIGDLPGITARLDHLAALGVDAVWLSPFYRSPQADAGYDVADYRDVDPLFGTLDDFDALLARAHELGLRVVVDLVPNHTSDEHVWFQAALAAGTGSPERERYLFRDGRGVDGAEPPNNWQSIFGGPAWTRTTDADGTPGQWYLHLFDSRQPDLNWEHPQVRSEFEDVLRFWLDRGVDGFRIDVAHGMVKEPGLPDWDGTVSMIEGTETPTGATGTTGTDGAAGAAGEVGRADEVTGSGNAGPMFDQDGVHEIYRAWHQVLAGYAGDRALVAEAWVEPLSRLALYVRPDEMQQAFNFAFLAAGWHAGPLRDVITASYAVNDSVGAPTTWVLSNHDVVRHASRFGLGDPGSRPNGIGHGDEQPDEELGLRRARAAALLMLALPGSAYVYQGEELGLPEHTALDDDLRQDPSFFRTQGSERGRDGCRVPLPWEKDAAGFGFSPTGVTWLPQPTTWGAYAADAQRGVAGSTYELYRTALAERRARDLGLGGLTWAREVDGDDVVAFHNGELLVVANLGQDDVELPAGLRVVLTSTDLAAGADGTLVLPSDATVWAVRED